MFNSCENLNEDIHAILNKGGSPSTVSASVVPVFMIALINTPRMGSIKICLE